MRVEKPTPEPLAGDEIEFRRLDPTHWVNRTMLGIGDVLRAYHRHAVEGLDHLAEAYASGRPVMLVGNHCFDIVDPLMLTVGVERALGIHLRFIGHGNLFYTLPLLRTLAPLWGILPNRHMGLADAALGEERLLMLYPGSGTEAILRRYRREPYRLKWYDKVGFVELAARHDAIVLFVAGLGIDELYYQTDWRIPAALLRVVNAGDAAYYEGARLQLGVLGPHLVPGLWPLPVRVTHVVSPPLALPRGLDPGDRQALARAQLALWAESQAFLDRTVAERSARTDVLDRACRTGMRMLEQLGV